MFILNGGLYGVWASRIPAIAERHALGAGQLGVLLLVLAAGAVVAFPFAGRAADRFGAALVTRGLAVVLAFALIAVGAAPTISVLAVALFAFGAALGGMDVAMNSWAAEVERHMGRPVMSSFHAMFSLGAGLGAGSGFLAGSVALTVPLHFTFAALSATVLMLWVAQISWESQRVEKPTHAARKAPMFAIPKGPLIAVGLVTFCAALGEGALADWGAIYLVVLTEADEARAALGFAAFSLAMVAMRLLGDRITQWCGPVLAIRFAGSVAVAGSALVVIWPDYSIVLIGFALMGVGYALVFPLAFSRAANDPNLSAGEGIASVATLGYGGVLLGPPVIGFLAEISSLRMAFVTLVVLSFCLVGMAGAVRTPNR
ncbi:MAG: MFS transporter [Paracoccaceae bacterium]